MFSTSTTASSTSSPMAIASPPSVIVLMESPIRWKMMAVDRIETGMAVSEIAVVRQLSRKANSTTATTATASKRTLVTLSTEVWMKLAWRKRMLSALMPCGQRARELGQGALDLLGEPHRVDVGLLFDGDDDGGRAHVAGVAALGAGAKAHLGHLPQVDRPVAGFGDDEIAEVFELERAADVADQEFLRVLVGEAAARVAAELRQRFLELLVGDAKGAQGGRVGRDAVLAHFPAHRNDLGHAGNGEQPRAHHEIGDLAHAHRRHALGRRHARRAGSAP